VDWIQTAQDKFDWWYFVDTVMNICVL